VQYFQRLTVDCRPDEDLGAVDETKVEVDGHFGSVLAVRFEELL
jgi:hypothetical protein